MGDGRQWNGAQRVEQEIDLLRVAEARGHIADGGVEDLGVEYVHLNSRKLARCTSEA